ncbi:hypothetical protein V8E54_000870 [Elaphomyces granulatus]
MATPNLLLNRFVIGYTHRRQHEPTGLLHIWSAVLTFENPLTDYQLDYLCGLTHKQMVDAYEAMDLEDNLPILGNPSGEDLDEPRGENLCHPPSVTKHPVDVYERHTPQSQAFCGWDEHGRKGACARTDFKCNGLLGRVESLALLIVTPWMDVLLILPKQVSHLCDREKRELSEWGLVKRRHGHFILSLKTHEPERPNSGVTNETVGSD